MLVVMVVQYIGELLPDLDINGYTFINNSADFAGAIYYAYALSNKVFDNIKFINNTATSNGGALFIVEGSQGITFNDCNFTGNGAPDGYGGAIYFNDNSRDILFEDSTFDDNYAKSGGAIQFYANVNNLAGGYSNVDIINCNFTNNDATYYDGYGGSAITFNLIDDLNIDGCKFDSNVAAANGALMFDYFSDVSIKTLISPTMMQVQLLQYSCSMHMGIKMQHLRNVYLKTTLLQLLELLQKVVRLLKWVMVVLYT